MSPNRKIFGAAAFSLALAGGGVAGALLGTPTLSTAQSASSLSATADPAAEASGPGRFEHRAEGLAAAAEALGMSEDDLRTALKDGKSMAEVAADQGVEVQDVVDALVANASARLDARKAELPDRMAELVNRKGGGDHGKHPGRPGGPGGRGGPGPDATGSDTAD